MVVITDPHELAREVARARMEGARTGFIPTMGALHQGHLELVHAAITSCDMVVSSVFVNPLQFNDKRDLENYPRRLEEDRAMLASTGCDLLFAPEARDLFHGLQTVDYDLGGLDQHWEGPLRPGHFLGVINVVERLFFYCRPDQAFFGEKDRQQLAILQHVARTCLWPEELIPCPTVRELDGLAMSSRNQRLDTTQRQEAAVLFKALTAAARLAFDHPVEEVKGMVETVMAGEPRVHLEYFGLADPATLLPVTNWNGLETVVALIAAQVGPVRLIDNLTLRRP